MCFVCSRELSHRDGSFEHTQHMFWLRNKKNIFCYALLSGGLLNIFYVQLLLNVYPINLQHSSCKSGLSIRVENSVDPDQMASSEASPSGSTVFSEINKSELSRTMDIYSYGNCSKISNI